jgi:uncharacterized protein YjaZ
MNFQFHHLNHKTAHDQAVYYAAQTLSLEPGFKNLEDVVQFLSRYYTESRLSSTEVECIQQRVIDTLYLCNTALPVDPVFHVFIATTDNEFVRDSMNGVYGFAASAHAILLFITPHIWTKTALIHTIAHEYNHTVFWGYHRWDRIIDGLVAEGLADTFAQEITNLPPSPWSVKHNKNTCATWYNTIKNQSLLLPPTSTLPTGTYRDIFTNPKSSYPHWIGYSIGYQLVQTYRNSNRATSWATIMKQPPEYITQDFDQSQNM